MAGKTWAMSVWRLTRHLSRSVWETGPWVYGLRHSFQFMLEFLSNDYWIDYKKHNASVVVQPPSTDLDSQVVSTGCHQVWVSSFGVRYPHDLRGWVWVVKRVSAHKFWAVLLQTNYLNLRRHNNNSPWVSQCSVTHLNQKPYSTISQSVMWWVVMIPGCRAGGNSVRDTLFLFFFLYSVKRYLNIFKLYHLIIFISTDYNWIGNSSTGFLKDIKSISLDVCCLFFHSQDDPALL